MNQNANESPKNQMKNEEQNFKNQNLIQNTTLPQPRNSIYKCSTLYKMTETLKAASKSLKDGKFIFDNIVNFGFIQKFFGENIEDENMAVQLCRQMGCEEFKKGVCIMKQGDESNDKLYVIIKGKVGIVIAKDTNIFKKVKLSERRERTISLDLDYQDIQQVVDLYGTKVNELSKGDGFGEKALLLKPQDAKRNATIIALEDTTCITVLRNDFLKILENFNKENQLKEQLLYAQMPFLKLITSTSTKEALMLYFKNQSTTRGKCLTEEGKQGEDIFILQQGKVVIEKKFKNCNNIYYSEYQSVKLTEISEPTFLGEEILFIDQEIQEVLSSSNNNKRGKNRQKNLSNSDLENQKNLSQSTEDLTQQSYKYTIRVDSLLCKFLIISKHFFLTKFPKEILLEIKQNYIKKEQIRQKVFNQMKDHKAAISNIAKYNIEPTFHMMNAISNKDIFSQMQPQMIESYNKTLLKKQEIIESNIHKQKIDNIEEEFRSVYRPDQEKKTEIIEKKKVLLQQKLKQQNRQKSEEKQHRDSLNQRPQSNPSSQRSSPLQSPRSNRSPRYSTTSQEERIKKRVLSSHSKNESVLTECQTPLEKLKQKKNNDGSLNIVELAQNLKYNKIQIDEVSVTDIMGENYDIYENLEASRLLTIKSQQSKEKQMQIEQLKEEYETKKVQQIFQKIQKGEVQNLDLGYLNSFKKQQHYKLVQLGKLKVETKSNIKNTINSLKLSQDLKQKIIKMKNKQKEDLQQETSNLIQNMSYLTPSSQLTKKYQNFLFSSDVSNCDNFSEYISSINKSNRQLSSAFSNKSRISYSPQQNSNRSSFTLAVFNHLSDSQKDSVKTSETPRQNQPDLEGLNQLINSSLNKAKTLNSVLQNPKIQFSAYPRTSIFSRDLKSRQVIRAQSQSSIKRPATSINQKDSLNTILTKDTMLESPTRTEEYSLFFQTNTSNQNYKNTEESINNTQQSPFLIKTNSSNSHRFTFENMGLFKGDKINNQQSQGGYFQPQLKHTRQVSCLTQIGQSSPSQQNFYTTTIKEKEQKIAQSPTILNKKRLPLTQSSQFKHNDFLALKFKQRQQLHRSHEQLKKNQQLINQNSNSSKINQLQNEYILITK
ncbi:zinc finger, C2H2 type family protein (macronuclear) [Tetrahymena thermophila SB210]|uniref:Zinc finger, C2H2 type family protein n=1 Tax=Tetrahymena thermophila (strain SB210) TaxID=312017 RepID=Q22W47_TETTS|nr:zinc finger, C2H2 type family protein [Tetrahymena thermophila SB210]EAR89570.2 zinc finger, C2H2 type family protein [Tetrahymena thermophila SB210]|eukprot:XP_001009815.2 zinc finger, C2H2 type family protein [Tetrahymena thermophila SB210]